MPTVLWWGRCDRDYSRNRILLKSFSDLGWTVEFYHPISSWTGVYEAFFHRLARPDLIWVPCFRHRDITSASRWAQKWAVPLVIDPLISAYEKEVFEKEKHPPDSQTAKKLKQWEACLFSAADVVVADTPAHAGYYRKEFNLNPEMLSILHVGAEESVFQPMPPPALDEGFEILFYGSFLQLQGAEMIIKAAEMTTDSRINWTLLGSGDLKSDCMRMARGMDHIRFEPWIEYHRLPHRMAKAQVILGVFGVTPKADLVIPNKVFQAMAVGRPIITRRATAYENSIETSDVIGWVPAGEPEALALIVKKWFRNPSELAGRGRETRKLYETYFGRERRVQMLEDVLEKASISKNG